MSERKWQEQLRAARRGSKKKVEDKQPKPVNDKMIHLVLHLRDEVSREFAFRLLDEAQVLPTYCRKFRYHDPKQQVCMKGELYVGEVPFTVARQIESELAAAWQKGAKKS